MLADYENKVEQSWNEQSMNQFVIPLNKYEARVRKERKNLAYFFSQQLLPSA